MQASRSQLEPCSPAVQPSSLRGVEAEDVEARIWKREKEPKLRSVSEALPWGPGAGAGDAAGSPKERASAAERERGWRGGLLRRGFRFAEAPARGGPGALGGRKAGEAGGPGTGARRVPATSWHGIHDIIWHCLGTRLSRSSCRQARRASALCAGTCDSWKRPAVTVPRHSHSHCECE